MSGYKLPMEVEATIQHQAGEIMQLKQQLAECERERDEHLRSWNRVVEERIAVTKERDELVVDAKRYRWLRTQNPRQYQELWNYCLNSDVLFDEQVDECIHEALAKLGDDKTGEK